MLYFSIWKKALVIGVCLLGIILAAPNAVYDAADDVDLARSEIARLAENNLPVPADIQARADVWPSFLPANVINLGLDLRGGAHLLVEVNIEDVIAERMKSLRSETRDTLRDVLVNNGDGIYTRLVATRDQVSVRITDPAQIDRAVTALEGLSQGVTDFNLGITQPDLEVTTGPNQTIVMRLSAPAQDAVADRTMAQSLEIIRRRVDEAGTREPTIQRQGERRILVQVPGVSSTQEIKALIGKTAKLSFHLVESQTSDLGRRAGPGLEIFEDAETPGVGYIVEDTPLVSGDSLDDAQPGFDSQTGEPVVNFRFDTTGARKFGRATSENVGVPFAVVLDDMVITAPVIREPILGGSGQISGSFTVESAQELAILLRAGALPASISFEEERTVGPGLGADSIAAGQIATLVAFIAVLVFMALSYGLFGLFANVALIINVALIMGFLSVIGATLTLPGIAGIVLTIGMAVDANVLIFERIREELRSAKGVARAIELGYERALSAIVDANVTTFIAALILFSMGAGPVRGFAVTLGVGILTSVFTAFMVTRLFVSVWYGARRPKTLEI
ncbi:MAG: protein translocase subunit SecD [Pseudomonadota bacterium]